MQGQRAVVQQPRSVTLQPFEVRDPQPGEVVIRTHASLISPGTERAFYLALPNTNASYPLYPGYSATGEVIAVGDGVAALKPGDRVAAAGPHASHIVMPEAACVPVPENIPDAEATFFNLIAIAMQGVRKARIELGEAVAVVGLGPIGACAMQLARLSGALPVIAVDLDDTRLELARVLGADAVLHSDEHAVDRVRERTHGSGASVVIEATGAASAILASFQMAAVRGRVILLGSARGETDHVNFYRDVHRKGLAVIGAHEITRPRHDSLPGWWTQHDEHVTALKLLSMQRMTVKPLISHHFNWQDFTRAYDLLAEWDASTTGIVIDWQAE